MTMLMTWNKSSRTIGMDALRVLKNQYVFAVAVTVVSTLLAYFYVKTTRATGEQVKKFCCKMALFTSLAGLTLAYLAQRPEPVLREPFYG